MLDGIYNFMFMQVSIESDGMRFKSWFFLSWMASYIATIVANRFYNILQLNILERFLLS